MGLKLVKVIVVCRYVLWKAVDVNTLSTYKVSVLSLVDRYLNSEVYDIVKSFFVDSFAVSLVRACASFDNKLVKLRHLNSVVTGRTAL